MEQEYETIDLREIFALLKNNIWLILTSTFLCAVLGFMVTWLLITPKYEASATMLVNTRQDQNANVTNDQINSAKQLVGTYSIIIKSDTVLDKVIANLNLDMDYQELYECVTVSDVESTQVMRVAVRHPSKETAKHIMEEIIKISPHIIKDTVEAGSVKVISAARVEDDPVSPSKTRNTLIMAVAGLVLSIGYVVLRNMLNNKIETDDDIRKYLDLPVLGVIPRVEVEG